MSKILKTILLLFLFNWCECFDLKEKYNFTTYKEVNSTNVFDCPYFFNGQPWPRPRGFTNLGVVRLCQAQHYGGGAMGPFVFATLFKTTERIPMYTANAVVLYRNVPSHPRPSSTYWERVAVNLCNIHQLPQYPMVSNISFVHPNYLPYCKYFQAIDDDYRGNTSQLDRGHLSPSSINAQDLNKQYGTFTLTNAAPQYHLFNCNSWNQYECVTKQTILDFAPGETVFIITGTFGSAGWMNYGSHSKSPVKIPAYYYKAVCYPGSQHSSPWGYAIVQENVNIAKTADYRHYITLQQFTATYFYDPPFSPVCINASFGPFASIFPHWQAYLRQYCSAVTEKNQEC